MKQRAPFTLDELELDAFTELVNIGLSRAAGILREMVHEQVHLTAPKVSLAPREEALASLTADAPGQLVAVHMAFTGDMSGHTILIFPRQNVAQLTKAIAGVEPAGESASELEREVLAETGNIILNGYLSTIANMLQHTLDVSLPVIIKGDAGALFDRAASNTASYVLSQSMNFEVRSRAIEGRIVMIMDIPSMNVLKSLIDEFIARAVGSGVYLKTE